MVKLHGTPLLRPRRWDWATPFRLRFCSVVLLRAASAPAKLRLLSTSSASTSTSRTSSVSAAGDDVPQLTKTCAWQQCHVYYLPDFHVYLCYVDLCYVDSAAATTARLRGTWTATTATVGLRLCNYDCASVIALLRLHFCDCAALTHASALQACSDCATANSDCWACDCWAPTAGLVTTELRRLSCEYCASATAPIATARQLLLRRCDWAAGHNDRTVQTAPLRLHRSDYTALLVLLRLCC